MKRPTAMRQPTQAELQPILQALNTGNLADAETAAKKS